MQAMGKEVQHVFRVSRKKEQPAEDFSAISGARVLLVEDNEINQQVALEILQGAGLNVTVANNGQEGIDEAYKNQYDAILMDIQMPVMDGHTATRKIREWEVGIRNAEVAMGNSEGGMQNEGKDPIPIIAMTAHAMAGDEQKSLAAGMNDHVTKPIDPDQLFAALLKWIKPIAARGTDQKPPGLESPAQPAQASPDQDGLPESLAGFNLAAGLARLMGNRRLYRKLLLDFGANYGGVAAEIREALDAGDFNQAHSLVHNLKGLAGNLEATGLQAAAVEMEKLVKGQAAKTASDTERDHKLSELASALELALEAVQTLAEKKTVAPNGGERPAAVPELAKAVIDRINAAAEMGDVMQVKSIAEELKAESDAMAPFCNQLVQLAENFDFDGIQKFMLGSGS
jgi:CheY-like chemotaxis protein